jgi:HicB_like antitoxin of bacterial toxin-antitoxin system
MPVLTSGNTGYTHPVAKVLISIPDALLERVDAQAKAVGESRSGFLQRLAERELRAEDDRRRREIRQMLDEIAALEPGDEPFVDAAQMIREDRESH